MKIMISISAGSAVIISSTVPCEEQKVLRVAAEGVDVGEAADGVEVELLVVIERRLVAQALPDGVRVGLVLLVQRVPGEWLGVDGGHRAQFSSSAMVSASRTG